MKNEYEIRGDITVIFLYHRETMKEVVIDTTDLERLKEFDNTWGICESNGKEYVYGHQSRKDNQYQKSIILTKWILGDDINVLINCIDGNNLNYRRNNLVKMTYSGKSLFRTKSNVNNLSSKVPGVSWHKKTRKWMAYITYKGKRMHLGYFTNIAEASYQVEMAREKYLTQEFA